MARVLVVEDNPESLDLMVYLLEAFGHVALSAHDGLEGIEVARLEHPDLILCDIQLPGANGVEVCHELKKDPALRRIPLVATTSYAMVGDREKLLSEGFNGYMSKPITPQIFIDQMALYLPTEKDEPLTDEIKSRKSKTRVA
jgi:two-component system, cell cycle response regulator DivK